MTLVEFEVTDDQGYALAELVKHLDAASVRKYAQDETEAAQMCQALTDLQLALEFAGYFPR
jgi:hypothetical protein